MAAKVPIRFYQVKNGNNFANYTTQLSLDLIAAAQGTPSPSRYLLNLTDANIQTDEKYPNSTGETTGGLYIIIQPQNIPDPALSSSLSNNYYNVFVDNSGNYYVIINGNKWYIYTNQSSQNTNPSQGPIQVFEFYVNPQRITPSYKKLQTPIYTRGGWDIQHWGDELTSLQVNGISGGMQRIADNTHHMSPGKLGQSIPPNGDITQSTAWKKLTILKKLYQQDHNVRNVNDQTKLGMNYWDSFYIGYFQDFTGPEADSEQPYYVNYSFTFICEQEIQIPI